MVSADGGPTVWLKVPGDPRNNYIARMDWAASSDEVVLQHFNRLQNTDEVMLGDAATGDVHTVLTERDSAWVDVVDDLRWVDGGKSFTWISERDGWRHLYVVSRDGKKQRLVTKGAFDLHNPYSAFGSGLVAGVDSAKGWIYYSASPGERDPALPLPQPARRQGQARAGDAARSAGVPPVSDLERRTLGAAQLLRRSAFRPWWTSSPSPITGWSAPWWRTGSSRPPWRGSREGRAAS